MYQLMWFRNDLRITDNQALSSALAQGPTQALFIVSTEQWKQHLDANCKIDFWYRNLLVLQKSLEALNIPLRILYVPVWKDIAQALSDFCHKEKIQALHLNLEYGLNEENRDLAVIKTLETQDIPSYTYQDKLLFNPGSIRNQSGDYFKVFTAFKKQCLLKLHAQLPSILPSLKPQKTLNTISSDTIDQDKWDLKPVNAKTLQLWPAGEDAAQARLSKFCDSHILNYQEMRDIPDVNGTSQLSTYLNSGLISIRQCLLLALNENKGELDSGSQGVQTWISELLWREFYNHLLYAHPNLSKGDPFKIETNKLAWRDAPEELKAWQEGKTGFPIIDAAMQQLLQTGWMHNRLRMVCAMFLTKNLLIDWRQGEAWFMQHLIDGDLAANNGGWQWSASTGTDAVPYFRIFNPVSQSERFDPEGYFIKKWLPMLKHLDKKKIHLPYGKSNQALISDYPAPMVDLASSRIRALSAFKNL